MAVVAIDVDSSASKKADEADILNNNDLVRSQKNELRAKYRAIATAQWGAAQSEKQARELAEKLNVVLQSYEWVVAFRALPNEPNLNLFFEVKDVGSQRKVVYPKVEGERLALLHPKHGGNWLKNSIGIDEPVTDSAEIIAIEKIEAFVIPGLAFDRKLNRLGRGGGYYDRILTNSSALKIGVCAAAQITEVDLPAEEHDQALDILVTEKFILKREKKIEPKRDTKEAR